MSFRFPIALRWGSPPLLVPLCHPSRASFIRRRIAPFALASLLLTVGSLFTSVAAPSVAHAQVVAITNKESLPRIDAAGGGVTKRDNVASREGVNLDDCHADQKIQFPVTMSAFAATDTVEVWASDNAADCTEYTSRPGIPPVCYRLTNASFVLTATQSVTVTVKDLIRGTGDASTLDSRGCRLVNLSTVTVYFMLFRGGPSTKAAASDKVAIKFDTVGPRPLSNIRVLPGDTRIQVSWDGQGEGGTDDITGAKAYCDTNPTSADATASDAGSSQVCVTAEASADASEAPEPTCTTVPSQRTSSTAIPQPPNLDAKGTACTNAAFARVSGVSLVPDALFDAKYKCGDVSGSVGTTIVAPNLVNGQTVAVAVAAVDSFGNVGELSSPICQYPEPTSDFWRDYRSSGGSAGGGFCSVDGPGGAGAPAGSFAVVALAAVMGVSTVRRRTKLGRTKR